MKSKVNVSQCTLVVCVLTLILVCVLLFRETREGFYANLNASTQITPETVNGTGTGTLTWTLTGTLTGTGTPITEEQCKVVKTQYDQCIDTYDESVFNMMST